MAVVKSDLFKDNDKVPLAPKPSSSTEFSTMAPLGIVPTVGKFFWALEPLLPAEKPPVEIPDTDVPLVEPEDPTTEIDEPDVPLIDVPGTPVEEIDEPEIPLGDAPKTGDAAPIVGLVGLLIAAVTGLVVTRRKFN